MSLCLVPLLRTSPARGEVGWGGSAEMSEPALSEAGRGRMGEVFFFFAGIICKQKNFNCKLIVNKTVLTDYLP